MDFKLREKTRTRKSTRPVDWTFNTSLRMKKPGKVFKKHIHVYGDKLLQALLTYYHGRVKIDEVKATFIKAGFSESTYLFRIKDRLGVDLEFEGDMIVQKDHVKPYHGGFVNGLYWTMLG